VVEIKTFEIIRTKDLQSFYVIGNDPLDAMQKHWKNLDSIQTDKLAQFFDTGYSYVLKHNNDVYCLVYRFRK
jgi:hypothetical protein